MSVDTRTPGFDDLPALSMVKVPCDPAQVVVNHASFRVQLAPNSILRPAGSGLKDTARIPAVSGAGGRRRAPVVWSGKSAPDDTGAIRLLQAVRNSGVQEVGYASGHEAGATQVIPRVGVDQADGSRLGGPGGEGPGTQLLPRMREAVGAYDEQERYSGGPYADGADDADDAFDDGLGYGPDGNGSGTEAGRGSDGVRHAYYPDRRMNLGVVLLPLRVFLGFISMYAGMGKLCDPVYFDGGERGSMVKWLHSLHPWALASPLRDFALSHPVGAGLTIAFLQVVVGVLTVLGLWQRVAGVFGALLSAALVVTVSWRTVPVYDAPDIIYLAAWSPLIIAGAPVYSIDSRLAGEAWRTLGPRSELAELRRRVLRRGAVVASVVVGLTLIIGAVLGGAVRSAEVVTVPGPNTDPTNRLPGQPLPQEPGASGSPSQQRTSRAPAPSASGAAHPSAKSSTPATVRESATAGTTGRQQPSETQGTGRQPSQQQQQQAPPPPAATSAGPSASGGTSTGGGANGGSGTSGGGAGGSSSSGGGSNKNPIGGLLG
ncbi:MULTISPECIES: DoxX family membrane protein [unclassified Streptomyces]|uniref:DoxX family membrane protein n=1 Tax=unclassified Streptomyces TaxID=2593676 RepID=UPI002E106DCB|nr:DoxX family membrane protein [Streptomyces sp. NBC_01197]WSS50089.1 DoxX family membrane protein [Streptomyces sp. NBC_01180]